ncbi:ferric-chelate reductase [Stachybotrys elegans]|uniref:Ferric-chelate reductase n=1 Tax=Stachybotrys elegans TaxID=80388 RepID=A0A8K0SJL6_9HYPO|nr:ferric-chelate reductase [Stachybotrys elegans]
MRLTRLAALGLVFGQSAASLAQRICLDACELSLASVPFPGIPPRAPADARPCRSDYALASTYLCLREFCAGSDAEAAGDAVQRTCREGYDVAVPSWRQVVANYTAEDVARLRRVSLEEEFAPGETVAEVVVPREASFMLWQRTLVATRYVYKWHYLYGLSMVLFWAAVAGVGICHRVFTVASYRLKTYPSSSPSSVTTWFRHAVSLPATFGYRRAQSIWWCTIPPRLQTLTLLAFLFINVLFCIIGYDIFPGNIYYPSVRAQVLRYVSDRTGIISFANFPVLWLFGMRNNVLLWLTGWDFGAYNNFHRWVARIATVQAVVHSVGYTVLILEDGGWEYYKFWWAWMFWWAGQLATVGMCALLGLSIYWMRRNQYEVFLILHILLSVLVLVTMLGHVSIFNRQYDALFWIPLFIWVLDRVIRAARIVSFNVTPWTTKALASYTPSSNIVRLSIPTSSSIYAPQPGSYYFLMVPDDPRCWESHPFTVALPSDAKSGQMKTGEEGPLLVDADESTDAEDASMTFLIRPYDSFTRRLRERAEATSPNSASVPILVEGPYGHTLPLHRFQNVLFLAGGSGIVVPLSYARMLSTRATRTSVRIHWAVRESQFAEDVLTDLSTNTASQNLKIDIYSPSTTLDHEWMDHTRLHIERLDISSTIEEASIDARSESMAVVACGPASLADDARRAVVAMLGRGYGNIEYFEESFNW